MSGVTKCMLLKFYYFLPFRVLRFFFSFCLMFSRKFKAKLMVIISPKHKINDVGNSEMPTKSHKVLLLSEKLKFQQDVLGEGNRLRLRTPSKNF